MGGDILPCAAKARYSGGQTKGRIAHAAISAEPQQGQAHVEADFVIIGGGSAGCVLANRLSADPRNQVILVEAGGKGQSFLLSMPAGFGVTANAPGHSWHYSGPPEPAINGRQMLLPRGKGLGGSSLINGMLYLRGHRQDYDGWRDLGNESWGYDDVLPFFQRAMHAEHVHGEADARGGPLWISDVPHDPLSDAFVASAALCGIEPVSDFNQGNHRGAGYFRMNTRNGVRMSTARAYLQPARSRPNLRVMSSAQVLRLLIEGGRVTGVEVVVEKP